MPKTHRNNTLTILEAGRDAVQVNIQGGYHEHHPQDAWISLSGQIDSEALHDAASRLSARCHPGTRTDILHLITMWMEGQTMTSRKVLWLHGSVGLGKSTIAETIARSWHNPSLSRYTASYFFSPRQESQATSGHLFIKTIVYQLALRILDFRKSIVASLADDPVLLNKAVDSLLEGLVIGPVTNLRSSSPDFSPVIVIDGLDQCASIEVQIDILQKVIGALRHHPFRFLVTSRPEQHLREAFNTPTLADITESISLDGYRGSDDDIRTFLQEGFTDILRRRANVMHHVPRPWPAPSELNNFVSKASGQFLYASMVLQYVDTAGTLPAEQLKTLKSPVGNSFPSLDGLYIAILNTCHEHNQTVLQRVLTMVYILHCPQGPEVYEDLLGAPRGLVTVTLSNMHSIIRFPDISENEEERAQYNSRAEYDHTQGLRLRHENFRDFLEAPARSGKYTLQTEKETETLLTFVIREILLKYIGGGHPAEDSVPPCRETWGYLKEHFYLHLRNSDPNLLERALSDLEESFHVISDNKYPVGSHIPVSAFHALNTLLTTIAKMVQRNDVEPQQRRNLNADHSHWAADTVLNENDLQCANGTIEDRFRRLYQACSNLLDNLYSRVLQSSPQLCEQLPMLLVSCRRAIPVQWVQDIFGDSVRALLEIPHSMRDAIMHQWESPLWVRYSSIAGAPTDVIVLNAHFIAFMADGRRCGQFYQSSGNVQPSAFRQILRHVFSSAWLLQIRSSEALSCLDKILKSLLASKVFDLPSYSVDDPRIPILNDLVSMDYCVSSLSASPAPNVASAWQTMLKILRWLYDQRQQARKPEHADEGLAKLLQDASDNIFRQILIIEAAAGHPTVTIIKPILGVVALDYHSTTRRPGDTGSSSRTTPTASILKTNRAVISTPKQEISRNHVSDTLLLLYGVRHSLDSFLKSPERAGGLHIHAIVYHTQLAEICLGLCRSESGSRTRLVQNDDESEGAAAPDPPSHAEEADWRTPIAQRAWRYHLERAQPTKCLLDLLRSMQPGDWLIGGSLHQGSKDKDKAKSRSVEAIIKWLQDLKKQPTDLVQRWKEIKDELERRRGGSLKLQRKTAINSMLSSSSSFV